MATERRDLVFFDMDHTIIDHDCDVSWKEFLIEQGLAPESDRAEITRYFNLYLQGNLPMDEFLEFQLRQLRGLTLSELNDLAQAHFDHRVASQFFPQALREIKSFLQRGIPVVLLTATNEAVARPVAETLQMSDMIATRLEVVDGLFTGRIVEPYCIAEGKVSLGREYCRKRSIALEHVQYFGDSSSDIPMLRAVGHPVVINPLDSMRTVSEEHNWPIRNWSLQGDPSL